MLALTHRSDVLILIAQFTPSTSVSVNTSVDVNVRIQMGPVPIQTSTLKFSVNTAQETSCIFYLFDEQKHNV